MATPRAAALALTACAALPGSGCRSAETGILIEVTAGELRPDRLVFTIGSRGSGTIFIKDPESSVEVTVAGRDLTADPYRLLVHEGSSAATPMSGAVLAYSGQDRIGFAALADTPFIAEKVLVYRLALADDPSVVSTATGCVGWTAAGSPHVIAAAGDQDCDDHLALDAGGDDCDDGDAARHPGAPEICDGKDNDCNDLCDDGDLDRDGDGFTVCGTLAAFPAPADGICGTPTSALIDCREGNSSTGTGHIVHPFAHEVCDGIVDACIGPGEISEPCLAIDGTRGCAIGARACNDGRGPGGSGLASECVTSAASIAVDDALCAAYAGPCQNDGEPWRCANARAATLSLDCTVAFTRGAGTATEPPHAEVCPGQLSAPTLGGAADCTFDLIGGIDQEGYVVGLTGAGDVPAASFIGCDARIAVAAAQNAYAPQPDEWVLVVGDAASGRPARTVVLGVAPEAVEACPAQPISCRMHSQ